MNEELTTILCGLFPVPTAYRPFQWILLVTSWQVALGPFIREEIEARDEVTHVASLLMGVYISLMGWALCSVAICGTHKTN